MTTAKYHNINRNEVCYKLFHNIWHQDHFNIGIFYEGVDSFDDDLVTDLNFLLVAMLRLSLDKEQILLSFSLMLKHVSLYLMLSKIY